MDTLNIFILVGAAVFILLLWMIVGFRHLSHLRSKIHEQWEVVNEALRKRQSLVPNLIETFRKVIKDQGLLVNKLIKEKNLAAKEDGPGEKKIEFEYDLTSSINELIELGNSNEVLKKDTNFLELRKEIGDLEESTLERTEKYNEMVRSYNKHRRLFVLKPVSWLFRFRMENC